MFGGRVVVAVLACLVLLGCQKSGGLTTDVRKPVPPENFPPMAYPEGNAHTDARWNLGRALFFDTRLSIGNDISCASCHLGEKYLTDGQPSSTGTLGRTGTRNSPSLLNVGYQPYFMREGAVPTLEQQVLVPIQEHNEFGHNIVAIVQELEQDATLRAMSLAAYGEPPSAYTITRALGVFERSLISGNSPYDLYARGISSALTSTEKAGMELFFSEETKCSTCHGGFNFTEYEIVNNGLYEHYLDPGLFRLTKNPADSGKFKVPSLRNVAQTAPYMHDGSLPTLDDVLNHYVAGGKGHLNQDERIAPLNLTSAQVYQLKCFLESLTDETYVPIAAP